jgi:hypothetical protein
MFLDQLGADPADERVRRACEYVLAHTQASSGGFGATGRIGDGTTAPPSAVIHCLNGNLLRALIGFGWLDDPRVQRAIDWEAAAITGEGMERWYASGTTGPVSRAPPTGDCRARGARSRRCWRLRASRRPDARRWSTARSTLAPPSS